MVEIEEMLASEVSKAIKTDNNTEHLPPGHAIRGKGPRVDALDHEGCVQQQTGT